MSTFRFRQDVYSDITLPSGADWRRYRDKVYSSYNQAAFRDLYDHTRGSKSGSSLSSLADGTLFYPFRDQCHLFCTQVPRGAIDFTELQEELLGTIHYVLISFQLGVRPLLTEFILSGLKFAEALVSDLIDWLGQKAAEVDDFVNSATAQTNPLSNLYRHIRDGLMSRLDNLQAKIINELEALEELIILRADNKLAIDYSDRIASILFAPYSSYVLPHNERSLLWEKPVMTRDVGSFLMSYKTYHKEWVEDELPIVAAKSIDDGMQFGTFLYELKEFKGLKADIVNLSRKVPGISSLYLLYSFAVKPLISDLSTFMEDYVLSQTLYINPTRSSSQKVWHRSPFALTEALSGSSSRHLDRLGERAICEVQISDLVVGTDLHTYYLRATRAHESVKAKYLSDKYSILSWKDIWDAVPFSWALEYFIEVSPFLVALDKNEILSDIDKGSLPFWYTDKYFEGTAVQSLPNQAGNIAGYGRCFYERKMRVKPLRPLSFSLADRTAGSLTTNQTANLLAVFDQLARS